MNQKLSTLAIVLLTLTTPGISHAQWGVQNWGTSIWGLIGAPEAIPAIGAGGLALLIGLVAASPLLKKVRGFFKQQ